MKRTWGPAESWALAPSVMIAREGLETGLWGVCPVARHVIKGACGLWNALSGGRLCPQRTAIGKDQVRAWSAPPSCKYSLWGFTALSSARSSTLTSPGTLHFRKLSWVFIPWFPEIWSPKANFIILDPTHFKPASVISLTNTQIMKFHLTTHTSLCFPGDC